MRIFASYFLVFLLIPILSSCTGKSQEEKERMALGVYTELKGEANNPAKKEYDYIWDNDLDTLPELQRNFIKDIVKSLRTSDSSLGFERLHSSVSSHNRCSKSWKKKFSTSTIKEQYAIRVKPGKKPNSLYISIRHQAKGENNKRNFFQMKNVVLENGKLVIDMNCDATFKMIDNMKNFKEWKNDHKCGYKIKYNNNSSMKSSSGVSSEKPVEGADLYEYCLRVCERNVELNNENMKSYQCFINDVEIEKSSQKLEWDKLNHVNKNI